MSTLIGLPLVILLGLEHWVLLLYEMLDAAVTLFSHSNIPLPRWINRGLHYVIVTPDLHRVHHSVVQQKTDSNFSAIFPVWDLVFRTFRADPAAPAERMMLGLEDFRGPSSQRLSYPLPAPFRKQTLAPDEIRPGPGRAAVTRPGR